MSNSAYILIVEDSPVAQKVMSIFMKRQGCTVDIAIDGTSALEKTLETRYDLILMDIGLSDGSDGFEITALIKEHSTLNKSTPVMAVTAHGEPEYREKAFQYGMVGYYTKPLNSLVAKKIMDKLQLLSKN